MQRYTFIGLLIALVVMAAVLGGNLSNTSAEPTADVLDQAVELKRQDLILQATLQAIEGERIENAAKMTRTQEVLAVTATENGRLVNQQATANAATATHQVWLVTVEADRAQATSTAQAQGTSTAQALIGQTATQQAQMTVTAEYRTQQAPVIEAQRTAIFAEAQAAELAASRERMTNLLIAFVPWVLGIGAFLLIGFVVIRRSGIGTILPDENGLMPGVVLISGKQKQLILPDRMFSPVLTVDQEGVKAPQLVDSERQEGTTRRAQAVQAINALPMGQQNRGTSLMNQTFMPVQARPSIEVMDAGQVRPWVDEVEERLDEEL